jgi:hypothetical protein
VLAVVQGEGRDPGAVQLGQLDRDDGPAGNRGPFRLPATAVRQQTQPRFGQVTGGRCGDAVAADPEARAQVSALAGEAAGRGQRGGGLQRGDDVYEPVSGLAEWFGPGGRRMLGNLLW